MIETKKLVVRQGVKDICRQEGIKLGEGTMERIAKEVAEMIVKASIRTKENRRTLLKPRDF